MDPQALNEWMYGRISAVQPQEGEFTPGLLAEELFEKLAAIEPELLNEWLHVHGIDSIKAAITSRLLSERGKSRARARTGDFAKAMERVAAGDQDALKPIVSNSMLQWYSIDSVGTRKLLKDMVKEDHLFVAGQYRQTATRSRLLAQFHEAIAARLAEGERTGDVLQEEEVDQAYLQAIGE